MKKVHCALVACAAIWSMSACDVAVDDGGKKKTNIVTPAPKSYGAYNGVFTGRTNALSQGLNTSCAVDFSIVQTTKILEIQRLEYTCDDGATWGFDEARSYELRPPTDAKYLAWDVFDRGKNVGFVNYSNSAASFTIRDFGNDVLVEFTQSDAGVRLERFRITSNNWVLFEPQPVALTKKN